MPWKLRKRQVLPVNQNLSSVYFSPAKFQLPGCNLSLATIWQMIYTNKLPKLCSATLSKACEQQTHFRSSLLSLRKKRLRTRAAKRFQGRQTLLANHGLALKIKELTRETSRKIVCGGYVKGRRSLCIAALFSQNDGFTKVSLQGLWD